MIRIPWIFERDSYQVKKICSNPDYWASNEGEFWYVNRSLGEEIELEHKKGYITQHHEKTRKHWNIKKILDKLFGLGNHVFSTQLEIDKGGEVEKVPTNPKPKYKKPH